MTGERSKMFLYPGMAEECKRRHSELQPEMKEMIHRHGGKNYSISLDRGTNVLYGYLKMKDEALWVGSTDTPINRKQWDYMIDTMETNRDNSPVCVDFQPVFHLD